MRAKEQAGLGAQASILMANKKYREALAVLKQQEDLSRAHNITIGMIMALGDQANLLDFSGDARGALALQRQVEQLSRKAGNHEQLAISLTNQAIALIKLRQPGEAWQAIDEAENLARSHGLAALGQKIQAARNWMKKYR
jgi:hypothetical protein